MSGRTRTGFLFSLQALVLAKFFWLTIVPKISCFSNNLPTRDVILRRQPSSKHKTKPFFYEQEFKKIRCSPTSLQMAWWFGGTAETEAQETLSGDSCELVAVRIESPSSNTRRIKGEITVEGCPLSDVWAILTDYDRLSIHVPNLVESRRVGSRGPGEQGDGSYQCRLFQKGAQKIIGFEFGASVTMDMKEQILCEGPHPSNFGVQNAESVLERSGLSDFDMFPAERRINFKCVDSQFFSAFDGEWRVKEVHVNGQPSSIVTYSVLVQPKGPVPVAALEWRIREDVPTNLRAVKRAAIDVGYEGVMASRNGGRYFSKGRGMVESIKKSFKREPQNWGADETMAAYLET